MPDWFDRLGAALLDAGLAATAISGLVVLAMLQCRQPARRRGWARAGMVASLALLPLSALNPVPRIDLRSPLNHFWAEPPGAGFQKPPDHTDWPIRPTESFSSPWDREDRSLLSILRVVGRIATLIYLGGVAIGLVWIGLGIVGASFLVRAARGAAPGSVKLLESLPFSSRLARPRLLVSDRLSRPVLVGTLRPVILIPPDLNSPTAVDRLRLSLLHELAHVENLDHRFSPVATLSQAFWFFVPTFWWIRDQLKLDQEFLADRRAVSIYGTSGNYASSLVGLASEQTIEPESQPRSEPVADSSSVPRRASVLFQRVQMLLKCPFPIEGETPLWWRWSTALTLAIATLAASCLTIRGLGIGSALADSPAPDAAHSFRIPQLTITQHDLHDRPFDLRYRLPDQFRMTLEVMAEPDDLPRLEILGHRLARPIATSSESPVYQIWHQVKIERVHGFDFLQVNGRSIPTEPHQVPPCAWFTFRPLPGQSTRIRDLLIEW